MRFNKIRSLKFKTGILALMVMATSCGKPSQETSPIRKDITETVFASGILEANGTYNLTAQTDGYLVQVYFKEGDMVKEGQVLAVIDNKQNVFNNKSADALYEISQSNLLSSAPSIVQARNISLLAKQKMEVDSAQAVRYKSLFETNSVSRTEYDNIQLQYQTSKSNYVNALASYDLVKQQADQQAIVDEAQKQISKNTRANNAIAAVFTGKVFNKYKQKGDFVRQGDVIATIGDPEFIYAKVGIDESSISKVKIGQEAIISINPIKGKTYKGKVAEIYPSFDEATQSFTCKLYFIDKLDFKIVNTQLQSNIIIGEIKNALLIPRNYLQYGDFVRVKGNKQMLKVTPRVVSTEWVLIESGITENDIIVTENIASDDFDVTSLNK